MAETEIDPYAVLGLSNFNASREDISKAARKQALKYHPDKNPSDEARDMFLRVQRAKDILLDDKQRAAIDDVRNAALKRKMHEMQRTAGMDDKRKKFRHELDSRLAGAMQTQPPQPSAAATTSASPPAPASSGLNNPAELELLRAEGQRIAEQQSDEARRKHKQAQSQQQAQASATSATAESSNAAETSPSISTIRLRQVKIKWRRLGESQSDDSLMRLMRPYGEVESATLTGTKGTAGVVTFYSVASAVAAVAAFAISSISSSRSADFRVSRMLDETEAEVEAAPAFSFARPSSAASHASANRPSSFMSGADLKAVLSASSSSSKQLNAGPTGYADALREVRRALEKQEMRLSVQRQGQGQGLHDATGTGAGARAGATASSTETHFSMPSVSYADLVRQEQSVMMRLEALCSK